VRGARLWHLVALIALGAPGVAVAADPACNWEERWSCFGVIEYRVNGQIPVRFMRTRIYANFEIEGQVIEDGIERRFLQVRPSQLTLFSEFVDKDFEAARNDRTFGAEFAEACFAPLASSLAARYPDPRSVPEADTTVEFSNERIRVIIITSRARAGTIAFHLIFLSPTAVEIQGNWTGPRRAPLPGDFDIGGWRHAGLADLHTLAEARAASP
jgi:hypothetical protein